MSNKLNRKELKFLKKYPNFARVLNDTTVSEYRLVNGMLLKNGGGSSGTTYTGTNGIKVNNTSHTIGLDDEGTTTPEISNLKITGDFVLDKGADFNADADAELNVYCEATFTNTVDMSTATIQLPSIALTGTSGTLTEAQWSVLQGSKVPYIEKDNNKYYYVGRTYDATTTTLVRTLTYVCANVGKIVITCNDPVAPATEYTYTWAYSIIPVATTTTNGLMSAQDKINLNGIYSLKPIISTSSANAIIADYNGTSSSTNKTTIIGGFTSDSTAIIRLDCVLGWSTPISISPSGTATITLNTSSITNVLSKLTTHINNIYGTSFTGSTISLTGSKEISCEGNIVTCSPSASNTFYIYNVHSSLTASISRIYISIIWDISLAS